MRSKFPATTSAVRYRSDVNEQHDNNGSSGRFVVTVTLAVCAAIFGAAAAIMDPSATRVLMTASALLFVVLSGVMLGATMAKARRHG